MICLTAFFALTFTHQDSVATKAYIISSVPPSLHFCSLVLSNLSFPPAPFKNEKVFLSVSVPYRNSKPQSSNCPGLRCRQGCSVLHNPCFRDTFWHNEIVILFGNAPQVFKLSNAHTLSLTSNLLCAFWWSQLDLVSVALFFIFKSPWISFTCNFNPLFSSSKLCFSASSLPLFPHSEVFSNCSLSSWEGFGCGGRTTEREKKKEE